MEKTIDVYLTLLSSPDGLTASWSVSDKEIDEIFDGYLAEIREQSHASYYVVYCQATGEQEAVDKFANGRYTDRVTLHDPIAGYMAAWDGRTGLFTTQERDKTDDRPLRAIIRAWIGSWDERLKFNKK